MREIEPPELPFVELGYVDADGVSFIRSFDHPETGSRPIRTLITTEPITFTLKPINNDLEGFVDRWIRGGRPRRDKPTHPVIDGELVDAPEPESRPALAAGCDCGRAGPVLPGQSRCMQCDQEWWEAGD